MNKRVPIRLLQSVNIGSLIGFEAAVRLGSFTAAAEALSLTQSAVSKQVKSLEDALGVALLHRGGRALHPTPAGAALQSQLAEVLGALSGALAAAAQGGAGGRLALTLPPALASLWLTPRLARLPPPLMCPEILLDASERSANLDQQGIDVAIRLAGRGRPRAGRLLMRERLQLVAAPALAARWAQGHAPGALTLLEFDHPAAAEHGMLWRQWFDVFEPPLHPAPRTIRFSQYEQVVQAAQQGLGLAIGRRPLVDEALEQGRLAVVRPALERPGADYLLLTSRAAQARPEVSALVTWLIDQAGHAAPVER